jgi:mono/diheme cytochrome c family protein
MLSPKLRISGFALLTAIMLVVLTMTSLPAHAQEGPNPETLALGAKIFDQDCAVCHGPNGEGRIGATLTKDWPAIGTSERLKEIISDGVAGSFMPAWSQSNGGPLTDEEIDAVVALLISRQTGDQSLLSDIPTPTPRPPITPIPDVVGDPNSGAALFGENCVVCHGANGEGRIGATLAKDWPAIRTDLRLKETISDGVSGSFMPAWGQANGGPLSDGQIDDLVAFILSLQPGTATVVAPTAPPVSPTPAETGGITFTPGLIIAVVVLVLVLIGGIIWAARG